MAQGDFGDSLRYRRRDIGDNQQDQDPVDDPRRRFPAASVLKDLKHALAQGLSIFGIFVHRYTRSALRLAAPDRHHGRVLTTIFINLVLIAIAT